MASSKATLALQGPRAQARERTSARELSDAWFVALTIIGLLAVTSAPYVFGYLSAPPDKQFMGILLDVPDHAQYFSWMRELSAAPLAANKLTPEPNRAVFFNLLWWGLGQMGRLLNLGYPALYQLLRVAVGVMFPLAIFRLCAWFLPDRLMRRTAFLAIMLTSGFGWVLVLFKYTLAQGELWFPLDVYIAEANTFLGLMGYPHFVGAALYVLVFDLLLRGEAKGQLRYAVGAGLLALVLGWQHAYDLVSVYGVLAAYAGLKLLRDRRIPAPLVKHGLVIGLISWWPALYSVLLTSLDPMWERILDQFVNAGVFTPSLLHLPLLLGAAFVLATFTVLKDRPWRLKGVGDNDLFLRGWFLITFLLVYLPVEYQVHLLNGWQVAFGILAARGLFQYVLPFAHRLRQNILMGWPGRPAACSSASLLAAVFLLTLVPTNLYLWAWRFVDLARHDYPYYLSRGETAALAWLDLQAGPDDVVLSSLTIGQYVPMLTGSHAFLAHWAQTVDFFDKSAAVQGFFSAGTAEVDRCGLLATHAVDFVFYGPAERAIGNASPGVLPCLTLVNRTRAVAVYAVHAIEP